MTVVDSIPTLLHASVFLFFIGLVEFLFPINHAIAYTVLSVVAICVSLYAAITVLPTIHHNSPYRTPLSKICWHILQTLGLLRFTDTMGRYMRITGDMVESCEMFATHDLPGRYERDLRALYWTMKSLTEASELEPFVEGISDVLSDKYIESSEGQSPCMSKTMQDLLLDPRINLLARIVKLLLTCLKSGGLGKSQRSKRAIACMNAITFLFRDNNMAQPTSALTLKFGSQIEHIARALSALQHDRVSLVAQTARATKERLTSSFRDNIVAVIKGKYCDLECPPSIISNLLNALNNFRSTIDIIALTPALTLSDTSCRSSSHYREFIRQLRNIYIPRHLAENFSRPARPPEQIYADIMTCLKAIYVTTCHFSCHASNADAFKTTIDDLMRLTKVTTPTVAHYALCALIRLAYHIQCDIAYPFRTVEIFNLRPSDRGLHHYHSMLHSLDVLDLLEADQGDLRGQFRLWHPYFVLPTNTPGVHHSCWSDLREFVSRGDEQLLEYTCRMSPEELQRLARFPLCTTSGENTSDFALPMKIVLSQGRTVTLIAFLQFLVVRKSPLSDPELTLDTLQIIARDLTVRFASHTAQSLLVELTAKLYDILRRQLNHLARKASMDKSDGYLDGPRHVHADPFHLLRKSPTTTQPKDCIIQIIIIILDIIGTIGDPESIDNAKAVVERLISNPRTLKPICKAAISCFAKVRPPQLYLKLSIDCYDIAAGRNTVLYIPTLAAAPIVRVARIEIS